MADKFYDPVLKTTWAIESASDYNVADNPRFKGQGNLVYIDPSNGSAL